jgi:3-O-methylgallate 3,4-dioxygenase
MLAAQLEDWLTKFRVSDLRMPYFDDEGKKISFEDVLARAPANAAELITEEAITKRFNDVQAAMESMKQQVQAAKLDVLIIVGDDQYEMFKDDHMPSLGVYYGETIRNAVMQELPAEEWYKRAQMRRLEDKTEANYPCNSKLAIHLIENFVEREFDVAAVSATPPDLTEGHAYSFVHRWYLKGAVIPIVPIFLNTYNWPNPPTPKRCVKFGKALRELIASYPEDLKVGLMASGGLSHFIVEEKMALRRKDIDFLGNLDARKLKAGSSEIRNWIVVASAATDLDVTWESYVPGYRTMAGTGTGLGFARWS